MNNRSLFFYLLTMVSIFCADVSLATNRNSSGSVNTKKSRTRSPKKAAAGTKRYRNNKYAYPNAAAAVGARALYHSNTQQRDEIEALEAAIIYCQNNPNDTRCNNNNSTTPE